MATAAAYGFSSLQMGSLNLNAEQSHVVAGGAAHTYYTIDGTTYATVAAMYWTTSDGVTHASVLAGQNLVASANYGGLLNVSGGTVQAYFEGHVSGGYIYIDWGLEGISYPAVSLYSAFQTPGASDDAAFLRAALSGNDTITGGTGDNVMFGGAGDDTIVGGSGLNQATYSGRASDYVIGNNGAGSVSVADTLAGRDGVDTLVNVQEAVFTDYALMFDLHSSQDLLVYKIYEAAYGRTPDATGFRYWAHTADTTGMAATALADQFLAAAEFTQVYGAAPSNNTYVAGLYTHVLGRAPDQGGLDYWVGLANGGMAKDALLVAFATSAENGNLIGTHASTAGGYWTTWN